jgi:Protein of unknown function (DUF1257)
MSHFSSIKTQFKDRECLVEALKAFGFKPQVHQEPQHLYGWISDRREEKAHIIVTSQQIGGPANDLGFLFDGEQYQTIISDYDQRRGYAKAGTGLGPTFLAKLNQQYCKAITLKTAQMQGDEVQKIESLENGTIRITMTRKQVSTIRR